MSNRHFCKNYTKIMETRWKEITDGLSLDRENNFEVALCQFLKEYLPPQCAICIGAIIDYTGLVVGKGIIVYDKGCLPGMPIVKNDFSQEGLVLFDAVYFYIETISTLDFSDSPSASLDKALSQISNAQKLQRSSAGTPLDKLRWKKPEGFPSLKNPFHTAIFSINPSYAQNGNRNHQSISDLLLQRKWVTPNTPDLIVAGNEVVVLPTYQQIVTPFCCSEAHSFTPLKVEHSAFVVGIYQILSALQWIDLHPIPWYECVMHSLRSSHREKSVANI